MNITLDGYVSGPQCELDWHFNSWTNEMGDVLAEELGKADTILLGKTTYMKMSEFWTKMATHQNVAREELALVDMLNSCPKAVFSHTLTRARWGPTDILKGDIRSQVMKLKNRPGKNIILYGSCQVADALIRYRLADVYHLWIHPVILGKGKPLFKENTSSTLLTPGSISRFNSGVILARYSAHVNQLTVA